MNRRAFHLAAWLACLSSPLVADARRPPRGRPAVDASPTGGVTALVTPIQETGGLDDKRDMGRRLGEAGTPRHRAALLALLADENYWNRLAGVDGLLVLDDRDADTALVARMLEDHMVSDDIERGLRERGVKDGAPLRDAFPHAPQNKQGLLLELLADARDPASTTFLQDLVNNRRSSHRGAAFKVLARRPGMDRKALLAALDDADLREPALAWLAEHGTREDLPLFLQVIEAAHGTGGRKRDGTVAVLAAYQAVAKLGDARQQEATLVGALGGPDETLARGALAAFPDVSSESLVPHLCRVVTRASQQATRVAAADRLALRPTKKGVPCMVLALRERFEPAGVHPMDAVGAFATLGLTTLLQGLGERMNQDSFAEHQSRVATALTHVTGQRLGNSHEAWREWAIAQGISVDGQNVASRLFSSRPDEREAAVRASLALLKMRGAEDVARAAKSPAPLQGRALNVALAQLLVERGLVQDETW